MLIKTPTCQARLLFEPFLAKVLLTGCSGEAAKAQLFSAAFFGEGFSPSLLFTGSSLRLQPPGWLETNPAYKMGWGLIVFGNLQPPGFRIPNLI